MAAQPAQATPSDRLFLGSRLVPDDVLRAIERFLYWEAFLLDERRYQEWLELFTDDVHFGRRDDVLWRLDGSWKILRRKILLDQTVLSADNLSLFF